MNVPSLAGIVQAIAVWAIPLILAITLHEAAHGFAALRFGDDTAKRLGRVTFNPLAHIDPFGTLILPALLIMSGSGLLFGWAKPVPVNFGRLIPQRLGICVVALAGPFTNMALAIVSAVLLLTLAFVPPTFREWTQANLVNSVAINLILAVFNLLPIPPLDGGRVLVGLLPRTLAMPLVRYEKYSMLGLMAIMVVLPLLGLNVFRWIVGVPAAWLENILYQTLGIG